MWVDYQPVDVEIDDDNIRILVFEMCIGMNEFLSTAPAPQRSGFESPFRSEFSRPFSLLLK